jgi:hypothetical protein
MRAPLVRIQDLVWTTFNRSLATNSGRSRFNSHIHESENPAFGLWINRGRSVGDGIGTLVSLAMLVAIPHIPFVGMQYHRPFSEQSNDTGRTAEARPEEGFPLGTGTGRWEVDQSPKEGLPGGDDTIEVHGSLAPKTHADAMFFEPELALKSSRATDRKGIPRLMRR